MLSYFSKPPTQLGMMIDDTVRLVCVHFVERKFQLTNYVEVYQIDHGMSRYKSSAGLIKTKNCWPKIC